MVTKKREATPVQPVAVETAETAEQIWEKIEGLNLDLFALPGQKVNLYFKPVPVEPSKLYLSYSVQAALPALEESLRKLFVEGWIKTEYQVGTSDRFATVELKKEE